MATNQDSRLTKEDMQELSSTEARLISEIEKKLTDFMVQKSQIDKQHEMKLRTLEQRKASIENQIRRAMASKNPKVSLRAAEIYNQLSDAMK